MNFPFLRAKERLVRIMGTFDLATGHADTFDELLDSLESELRDVLGHYREALAQQEPVAYSGNGTAGREADVRPTGFFFQMPKPVGEVYGWHGSGKGQPMCRFDTTETEMPIGTELYTTPPQPEERNFCQRCGKRTADLTVIHTCTPPQENT